MSELRDLIVSIDFNDININNLLQVDSAMDEIESNFRSMDQNINDAGRNFGRLGARGGNAMNEISGEAANTADALDEVQQEAHATDRALNSIDDQHINVDVDTGAAMAQLTMLQMLLNQLDDDVGGLGGSMKNFGGIGSSVFGMLIGMAGKAAFWIGLIGVALAAAIAAGAPLLVLAGGLAASMAAAGIGAVAFGAVATSALTGVFESATKVDEIQKKIDDASSAKERAKAEKELANVYDGLSKSQAGALKELQNFKSFWKDFVKQFDEPIFAAFSGGLKLTQSLLIGLAPTIDAVAAVVNGLITEMNTSVDGGGLKTFFGWLESNAAEAINNFAHIAGNVIQGVWNIMGAFSPIGSSIEESLLAITDKFASWSATVASSQGFQNFMDYAKTNGPVLMDVLKNVWDIILGVVKAFAPFGTVVLDALSSITKALADWMPSLDEIMKGVTSFAITVKENWDPIVDTVLSIGAAVGSFAIMMKGLQIIGIITTLFKAWRAGTIAETLAMYGLNSALLLNPITWIVAGIAVLIGIGVMLYRNWDTVSAKAGELWNWIKEAWGNIWNSTKEIWNNVTSAIGDALQASWDWVVNIVTSIGTFLSDAFNSYVSFGFSIWSAIGTAIAAGFNTALEWVISIGSAIGSFLTGLWDGIVTGIKAVWNPIAEVISGPFQFAVDLIYVIAKLFMIGLITILNWILEGAAVIWTAIRDGAIFIWTALKDGVMAIVNLFWTGLTTIFNAIATGVLFVWNLLVLGIQTAWNFAVNVVMAVATFLWTGITNIFNFILTTATTIWTTVSTAISVPFGYAKDFVIGAATAIWNWITTAFNAVLSVASSVWNAITTTISTAFTAAKNFVVETATNIWNTVVEKFNAVKTAISETMESVKTKISGAMSSATTSTTNFFTPLLDFVASAKEKWDGFVKAIHNFKMPSIKIPSVFGGGDKKDGSHATGLARVPFDGYRAELHKDEAVLTASQSDALRRTGVLDNSGSKPKISLESPEIRNKINISEIGRNDNGKQPQNITSSRDTTTNVQQFAPQITIQVNGGDGKTDTGAIAQAVKKEMEKFWMQMQLKNA